MNNQNRLNLTFEQKSRLNSRIARAKRVMQQVRICKLEGFVYIQGKPEPLTLKEFKRTLFKALEYRMNYKEPDRRNAERACDILKYKEQSRWWNARNSNHRAGSDTRGIKQYLARIQRKRVAMGFTDRSDQAA